MLALDLGLGSGRSGRVAYLLSRGCAPKPVHLELLGHPFEAVQGVLLPRSERTAVHLLPDAERAHPLPLGDALQRRLQAEQVAPPVALVAQDDFFLLVAALAELAHHELDVLRDTHGVQRLTFDPRISLSHT